MLFETIMSGFGGQGIMYMGDLFGQAAVNEGLFASFFPTYGVAMRGGTANCIVMVSDEEIGCPLLSSPNGAILMNQQSMNKFQPIIRPGGLIVANTSIIKPETFTRADDVRLVAIPAMEIAREVAGTERSANIVAFGAFLKAEPLLKTEAIEAIFRAAVSARKKDMIEKNLAALHAGLNFQ
jgi:2-oxoglutarate ferredoxin oxidoreductase subunit gamma